MQILHRPVPNPSSQKNTKHRHPNPISHTLIKPRNAAPVSPTQPLPPKRSNSQTPSGISSFPAPSAPNGPKAGNTRTRNRGHPSAIGAQGCQLESKKLHGVPIGKCKEFTITPVIKVGAGESIDFDKKDLKARRSQVFSGKELNAKIAALAAEKKVSNPKPQIAVMMVRVDRNEKVLDKSDSSYLDFPQKDASGDVAKGAKVGVLKNTVEVKLNKLEVKASVAINRKVKN